MDLHYTAHVPGGAGPFPTLIALHGWGANAHDLLGLAQVLHRGEALMLCPEGPVSMQIGGGVVGHGWYPIAGGGAREHPEFEAAARALRDFLELAVERYPVDRSKLIVLGFSQGGVMAYDLFLREPERFAALIALSSWLPEEVAAVDVESAELASHPVLVMHGTRDPMIDVERARESRKLLIERRLLLTYREHEMGHEISPDALHDLLEWLTDKVFEPIRLL